jgi:polyphenol oxidase
MLIPALTLPFPMSWGFSTKEDDPSTLPAKRLHQVHGTHIHEASDTVLDGDGLWTVKRHYRIGIRTADCVPILLGGMAKGKPWIAALHAGWRSAVGGQGTGDTPGILRACVNIFRNAGGKPAELVWALGPSIQKCHFEVGEEVIDAARKDPAWHEDLRQAGPRGRAHLDLQGFLRAQALQLGMDPAKDGSINRCTVCEAELLWSYRRDDYEGHQWGWVEIL